MATVATDNWPPAKAERSRAQTLDGAWQEAVDELPEGTELYLSRDEKGMVQAEAFRASRRVADGYIRGFSYDFTGKTPQIALRQLTKFLRENPGS